MRSSLFPRTTLLAAVCKVFMLTQVDLEMGTTADNIAATATCTVNSRFSSAILNPDPQSQNRLFPQLPTTRLVVARLGAVTTGVAAIVIAATNTLSIRKQTPWSRLPSTQQPATRCFPPLAHPPPWPYGVCVPPPRKSGYFGHPRSSSADVVSAALPSRNIAIRTISSSKPTALASAGGITHAGQETGLTDRPSRREVLLPSQEKPKNAIDYALYAAYRPLYRRHH